MDRDIGKVIPIIDALVIGAEDLRNRFTNVSFIYVISHRTKTHTIKH